MNYRSGESITIKDVTITASTDKAYKAVIKHQKDFYQEHFFWAPKNQIIGSVPEQYGNPGELTITVWFWGKIKESLQKTGIPISYTHNTAVTKEHKTLEAPQTQMSQNVPTPTWQMQEVKKLLKSLIFRVFKDPADLEMALDKMLVIQNNQVFLNLPATPIGPNQTLAEEMKSEIIQEILDEFFKTEEVVAKGAAVSQKIAEMDPSFKGIVNGWTPEKVKEWEGLKEVIKKQKLDDIKTWEKFPYQDFPINDPGDDDIPF